MDIWQVGYSLQKEIYKLVLTFPKREMYSLSDQLLRSANSVIANIAESHGRFHFADKIRILYITRGEIEETQSHLIVACSRKYLIQEECRKLIDEYERLKIKVNNYISSLSICK